MSLLTIIQDAMALCQQAKPAGVVASTDPTVAQFLAIAQREGDELARFHDWRRLKRLGAFTGNGSTTTFSLPDDYHRFMTGNPIWMQRFPAQALKRVSDEDMVALKSRSVVPLWPVWRLFDKYVEFYPAPANGASITTEYRTQRWIASADDVTRRARWAQDDDISVMPERLITLGVVWRWRNAQGLDYAEDFRTYQIERDVEVAADTPRETITVRERGGNPLTSGGDTFGLIPPVTP